MTVNLWAEILEAVQDGAELSAFEVDFINSAMRRSDQEPDESGAFLHADAEALNNLSYSPKQLAVLDRIWEKYVG